MCGVLRNRQIGDAAAIPTAVMECVCSRAASITSGVGHRHCRDLYIIVRGFRDWQISAMYFKQNEKYKNGIITYVCATC